MAGNKNSGRQPLEKPRDIQKRVSTEENELINNLRRLEDEAVEMGVNPENVKHAWIKSKESSLFVKNPLFSDGGLSALKIAEVLDRLMEKHKTSVVRKDIRSSHVEDPKLMKVIISDAHVGMNPNPDAGALFQYEYNKDIFLESMDKVFVSIQKEFKTHGIFEELHLEDYGDQADGWNGYTTRGGHELPQNLSNAEVFELCVDAKMTMVRNLVESKVAHKIVLNCISNDNHSGDFGLIINLTVKKMANLMYKEEKVSVNLLERFIEHSVYGDHCFIMTHGKDAKQMKRGFPIVLDEKTKGILNDYIDHYEITSKYIHVMKGDLHQIGYQRTKKFDYRNFMSFAPPSAWIQHNFGDSYSGYSIQVIPKHANEISHTDYFLDYVKKKS